MAVFGYLQERIKQLHNNYVSGDALLEYLACVDVRQESWNVKTYTFQAPRKGSAAFSFKACNPTTLQETRVLFCVMSPQGITQLIICSAIRPV